MDPQVHELEPLTGPWTHRLHVPSHYVLDPQKLQDSSLILPYCNRLADKE